MNYQEALADTQAEMAKLLSQRSQIDERLGLLKKLADTYSTLLAVSTVPVVTQVSAETRILAAINQVPGDTGITNAIRQVLAASKTPLAAPEIKVRVEQLPFDLSEYANARAVIHNTLTRLVRQREVVRVENRASQTVSYALAEGSLYKRLFNL